MADLTIPKGQTYPYIRGYLADEDGAMNTALSGADTRQLVVDDGQGGSPLAIDVNYVAPDANQTFELNGQTIPVNWECDYSGTSLASSVASWRGKLKLVKDGLVTYAPKDGFIGIEITINVTEPTP